MLKLAILNGDDEQVLLWGDPDDLRALSRGLRALVGGDADCARFLPNPLNLMIVEPATGMRRDGHELSWRVAASDALHFADLADVLASAPGAGHQYLDVAGNAGFGIEVKLSKGEYPDDFRS